MKNSSDESDSSKDSSDSDSSSDEKVSKVTRKSEVTRVIQRERQNNDQKRRSDRSDSDEEQFPAQNIGTDRDKRRDERRNRHVARNRSRSSDRRRSDLRSGHPNYDRRSRDREERSNMNRQKRRNSDMEESAKRPRNEEVDKRKANKENNLMTRTGGAYIPPARLKLMQAQIKDKASMEYQRLAWEALKKSINGLTNKVSYSNVALISRELFQENLIRGRGLLARAIIQAQSASAGYSKIYAALTSIINSKFPLTGELILKRLIIQFRRGFRRNDKQICSTSTVFIAHLINQQVAHEVIALELLTLLLENPTDDAVEVAIGFLKECGSKLTEVSPKGIHAIFERLRSILHEGDLDKRVQYMIEVMFAVRKDGFKDFASLEKDTDLVKEEDQFTHLLSLDETVDPEDILNVFKFDPNYEENEEKYRSIKKEILDESDDDDDEGEEGSEDDESGGDGESDENKGEGPEADQVIVDNTETNLIALRRTIYLTVQSSLDFEECAHKLLKLEFPPEHTPELCHMILDCCAQQRTYEKFYGLLGQRFCQINKIYVDPFQEIFCTSYDTIHRFETNKLRNVAKFFAHLLYTDAISWLVLSRIHLNEEETTSSSRIFIKILFQELCEYMGLPKLNERVKDVTLQDAFEGLFPRDHPKNTRFAINFFTSIGLGGLTDDLREHLKVMPKTNPLLVAAATPLALSPPRPELIPVEVVSSDEEEDSPPEVKKKKKKKDKKKKRKKDKKGRQEDKENKSLDREDLRRLSSPDPQQDESSQDEITTRLQKYRKRASVQRETDESSTGEGTGMLGSHRQSGSEDDQRSSKRGGVNERGSERQGEETRKGRKDSPHEPASRRSAGHYVSPEETDQRSWGKLRPSPPDLHPQSGRESSERPRRQRPSPPPVKSRSPPLRYRREDSPSFRSRREDFPTFRSRREDSPPLRSRRDLSPPVRSKRDDFRSRRSPPTNERRKRKSRSPPYH